MTNDELDSLFLEIHREIESAGSRAAEHLSRGAAPELTYPPNCGLTPAELDALRTIRHTPVLESAMRKVFADAAAAPIFHLLCLLDGVADPVDFDRPWSPTALHSDENDLMLHDRLGESYWAWRERRTADWRLDTLDD